eukprot:TRINITY_DN5479_c0_g2_i1.p1 TRINITY_DN5479_c0_g2~~TRINITY_DN5479_c0_g2_i1.p1  ORF type:complete len:791 (-),score=109.39 TRINITY_DN5479_c0_g2_i1:174-2546(-)
MHYICSTHGCLLFRVALILGAAGFTTEEGEQAVLIQTVKFQSNSTRTSRRQQLFEAAETPLECEKETGGTCHFSNCDGSRGPTDCVNSGWSYTCQCKQDYCNIAGRCVYSNRFDPAPASPEAYSPAFFFIKCWFGTEAQQAEITSGARASWDQFVWARDGDWHNKHVVVEGEFEQIAGIIKVKQWNLDGEPSSKVLAQKCQATLDTMPLDSEQHPFLYGMTSGAPNCTHESKCQGLHYEVPGWGPLFGPTLTFQDLESSHTEADAYVKTWVTFGDSLSDIGNFMWYAFKFPMSPYYFGHFCNGWVWQEHLSTALYKNYVASEDDIMNPPTGFVDYARGGSTSNTLLANGALKKYHAETKLNVTAFEHLKVGATGVLTGDLWNFLWLADKFARETGDPYSVTTGAECSEHGDWCAEGATCVGTRCIDPATNGKCELFTCTCNVGLHNKGGKCVATQPPAMEGPGPLAFVWQGANDLMSPVGLSSINEYLDDKTTGFMGYKQVVSSGVLNIKLLLDALYRRGYRSFAVPNLPNLGSIPMNVMPDQLNAAFAPGGDANASQDVKFIMGAKEMTKVSKAWNVEMQKMLNDWGGNHSDAKLVAIDFYSWLEDILKTNPYKQNTSFSETVTAGGESMTIQKNCMSTSDIPVPEVGWLGPGDVCPDQDNVIFWDNVHPGTRSQCFMASFFHGELSKVGLLPAPDMEKYKTMCGRDNIAWNGHSIHTGAYVAPSAWQVTQDIFKTMLDPESWTVAFGNVQSYMSGLVNSPHQIFEYAQGFWDMVIGVIQGAVPGTEKL